MISTASLRQIRFSLRAVAAALCLFTPITGGLRAAPAAEGALSGDCDPVLVRPVFLNIPADIIHLIQPDDRALAMLRISSDGKVIDWVPLDLPHYRLIPALGRALESAAFRPALLAGEPVAIDILATIPVGEASAYGIISETQLEHVESRLAAMDRNLHRLSLSLPGQTDAPLRLADQGQPTAVADPDGTVLHGSATVTFYLDPEGRPRLVRVAEGPHPALREAAFLNVQQFRFDPPRRGGLPTVVKARMILRF